MQNITQLDHPLEAIATSIRAKSGAILDRGVSALYIYGSRAKRTDRPGSDLDIYVDYVRDSDFSLLKLARIKLVIEEATGLEVHITTLNSIPAASLPEIAKSAIRII